MEEREDRAGKSKSWARPFIELKRIGGGPNLG